jgi:hypothetical protein
MKALQWTFSAKKGLFSSIADCEIFPLLNQFFTAERRHRPRSTNFFCQDVRRVFPLPFARSDSGSSGIRLSQNTASRRAMRLAGRRRRKPGVPVDF